jgi:hypothetical protein
LWLTGLAVHRGTHLGIAEDLATLDSLLQSTIGRMQVVHLLIREVPFGPGRNLGYRD